MISWWWLLPTFLAGVIAGGFGYIYLILAIDGSYFK